MTKISNLDRIAEEYHLKGDSADMFIENICQEFEFGWIQSEISQSDKILDLGYGDGLYLKFLKDHKMLTIVEGSKKLFERAVRHAAELNSNASIIHSFFEEFEPNEEFDVIIASHVLEHVDDPELLLSRVKKWLTPNGKLIIVVPNAESFHRKLGVIIKLQNRLDELSTRDHAVGHLRVFTLQSLNKIILNQGFKVVGNRGFFLKVLSNAQMINLSHDVIRGLCELSNELPTEFGANIGVIARNNLS